MELKRLLKTIRMEKITQIAVTGANRSGTGFGAYILARELKSIFVHERAFSTNDLKAFTKEVASKERMVLMCPSLLHCAQRFPENVLVVVMNRALSEILESQRRCNWQPTDLRPYEEMRVFDMSQPIAHIKYQFADKYLSRERRIEYLDYDSLYGHPDFVERRGRKGFGCHQIEKKKKVVKIRMDFRKKKGKVKK